MGLFSKRNATAQPSSSPASVSGLVSAATLSSLAAYGQARLDARATGRSVEEPFGWSFVGPIITTRERDRNTTIQQLYAAAMAAEAQELRSLGHAEAL
jgi:hypothetical protein